MLTQRADVSYAMPLLARIISSCTGNHRDIGGLWNLGKFSLPLNCIGLVYLVFTSITFNFPTLNPVTSEDVGLFPKFQPAMEAVVL